jgi:uncharacterized protein YjbJ (UPF0337 family)
MIIKEMGMNKDRIAGGWKQLKANARQQWGNARDDDADTTESRHGHIAKVLDKYGFVEAVTKDMLIDEPKRHKEKRKFNKDY